MKFTIINLSYNIHTFKNTQILCMNPVFRLHLIDFLLFLLDVSFLERLTRLIIKHHQVTVADIESGQMVARILRIEDILVHDESGSSRVRRIADSNLPYGTVFSEYVVHFLRRDFVREISYVQYAIYFRW